MAAEMRDCRQRLAGGRFKPQDPESPIVEALRVGSEKDPVSRTKRRAQRGAPCLQAPIHSEIGGAAPLRDDRAFSRPVRQFLHHRCQVLLDVGQMSFVHRTNASFGRVQHRSKMGMAGNGHDGQIAPGKSPRRNFFQESKQLGADIERIERRY